MMLTQMMLSDDHVWVLSEFTFGEDEIVQGVFTSYELAVEAVPKCYSLPSQTNNEDSSVFYSPNRKSGIEIQRFDLNKRIIDD